MKKFFQNHKKEIKYTDVEFETFRYVRVNNRNEKKFEKHIYTITGIGKKAIKYQEDHGDDEFAFYDSYEFLKIGRVIAKSFESEIWNENIRSAIAAQKQYCEENQVPHFAPDDGFCWSCGRQIYADIGDRNVEYAATNLITGCPHCHRSYCD